MYRFFVPCQNITKDKIIILDRSELHHIKDVLRLKPEDKVLIFDEKENEYKAIIKRFFIKGLEAKIIEKYKINKKTEKIKITVACAIPKKARMDEIVDKLTQLGTEKIIAMITERVIVRWKDDKKETQLRRYQRIALSAVKQSRSFKLPLIEIKDIKEVLKEKGFDLKLIPTLTEENARPLNKVLNQITKPKSILVLIGPEGDFSPYELSLAKAAGCIPVSLGDLVLRVETAVIAVVSYLRFLYM
ncbi:MAG: 16S rRNA (uracil(1498)-N(3))-methyltransferase [Candidatus Omnitrophica bacterium]|nr:16S rRNA (uracil(1498)-N(3))-methyltransferase [Candidatus Omnitrophota bacterium]